MSHNTGNVITVLEKWVITQEMLSQSLRNESQHRKCYHSPWEMSHNTGNVITVLEKWVTTQEMLSQSLRNESQHRKCYHSPWEMSHNTGNVITVLEKWVITQEMLSQSLRNESQHRKCHHSPYHHKFTRIPNSKMPEHLGHVQWRLNTTSDGLSQNQGAVSIRKTVLPGGAIPMLKIRRPNGRLIFNMEIAIRR